jgi:hypothetical protein
MLDFATTGAAVQAVDAGPLCHQRFRYDEHCQLHDHRGGSERRRRQVPEGDPVTKADGYERVAIHGWDQHF